MKNTLKRVLLVPLCILLCFTIAMTGSVALAYDECTHDWGEWQISMDPTCTENGEEFRECYLCGETQYRDIPKTGYHDWGDWRAIKKNTIYHRGKIVRKCYMCEKKQYKIIPKRKLTKSGKKAMRAVKKFARYARVYNIQKMKQCFITVPKNTFFIKKWYLADIVRKYNKKKYRCKIYDVKVKNNRATIKTKISYPNGYKPFMKTFNQIYSYYLVYPNAPDSEVDSYMEKQFAKNVNRYGMKKSKKTVIFRMKKTKNGWRIRKASYSIVDTFSCGYDNAYRHFGN